MVRRRIVREKMDNMDRTLNSKPVSNYVGQVPIVMADAYNDSLTTQKQVASVDKELVKRMRPIIKSFEPDGYERDRNKAPKNMYTKKLTLDESLFDDK